MELLDFFQIGGGWTSATWIMIRVLGAAILSFSIVLFRLASLKHPSELSVPAFGLWLTGILLLTPIFLEGAGLAIVKFTLSAFSTIVMTVSSLVLFKAYRRLQIEEYRAKTLESFSPYTHARRQRTTGSTESRST